MKLLFTTGMFRSGTTTLARALNAHLNIACASDPMAELFKALRSEEASALGCSIPVMAPLEDYYFDATGQRLLRRLLFETTLERPFSVWNREQLLEQLQRRCTTYSGSLVPFLDEVEGNTYRELLDSLITQIRKAYGNSSTSITGFKEVWSTEFIPSLARGYPEAKFIIVQRDPRAVCASKNVREDKYPWIFLARQWRKLAALDYLLRTSKEFEGRILSVRQEDLLRHPEGTFRVICQFLDVTWDPAIADPSVYRDGDGNPWHQNTAYGEGKVGFDLAALERWRSVLSERETALIELICGPEMRLFGYESANIRAAHNRDLILDPPRIEDDLLAQWMNGVVSNDVVTTSARIAQEDIRGALMEADSADRSTTAEELVQSAFLARNVMDAVCDLRTIY